MKEVLAKFSLVGIWGLITTFMVIFIVAACNPMNQVTIDLNRYHE
jgi:hypothetical protein